MRILIVFGSESDKSYYDPIHHKLKETHDVACEVISAHRNNLKLQQYLKDNQFDLIIAGAGIAAHLPGVVASLVKTPVIGLAVPAQYEGLDAFASILQMPYGIPVATTMADNLEQIEGFISRIEACKLDAYKSINLIVQSEQEWMARELDRSKVLLTDLGFEYTISSALKEDCINIALHTDDSQLEIADKVYANIPLIPAEKLQSASTLNDVFNWAKQAGIWFGTNNTRNAILYVSKLLRLSESLYFNAHYYLERKGSSKDLICKQGDNTHLYMGFTDRYSAFDWGEMPNAIPNKGESQAEFTYNLYKLLEKADSWQDASFLSDIESTLSSETAQALQELKQSGVNHHMKDLIRYHDRPLIKAQAFDVRFPTFSQGEYDYTVYNSRPENTVVPLEVIFRFGIPQGSSILKRGADKSYCDAIGVSGELKEGMKFDTPIVEFSTKFESKDRFIFPEVAQAFAGMSDAEFAQLKNVSTLIALRLKHLFQAMDIELWDGKFEFAFGKTVEGEREIILVDSIGADELRLTQNGKKLSKEILRQCYEGTAWQRAIKIAQTIAEEEKTDDWKQICVERLQARPHVLEDSVIEDVAEMYESLNAMLSQHLSKTTEDA